MSFRSRGLFCYLQCVQAFWFWLLIPPPYSRSARPSYGFATYTCRASPKYRSCRPESIVVTSTSFSRPSTTTTSRRAAAIKMTRLNVILHLVLLLAVGGSATGPFHKYRLQDLGPSPFIDEVTGQCQLNACDALGRARDELYTILDEKDKAQTAAGTLIGELQSATNENKDKIYLLKKSITQMGKRLKSLEQPGEYNIPNGLCPSSLEQHDKSVISFSDLSPFRFNFCLSDPCLLASGNPFKVSLAHFVSHLISRVCLFVYFSVGIVLNSLDCGQDDISLE